MICFSMSNRCFLQTHWTVMYSELSLKLFTILQSQLNEVLDAMFERKTQPGDHVIDQGDDGDNFYVIDK